jgi:acyl-CoA reductase-like NAD-dependent aldehyde dehydrogenase
MADSAAEILRSIPAISSFRYSSNDTSKRFTVENPATGAVVTTVQAGDENTTDEAVQAAQKAFENDWRWRPPRERSALLLKAADELEKHAQELAILLCLENGKPWKDALTGDFAFLFSSFRYFGPLADKLPSEFLTRALSTLLSSTSPLECVLGFFHSTGHLFIQVESLLLLSQQGTQ